MRDVQQDVSCTVLGGTGPADDKVEQFSSKRRCHMFSARLVWKRSSLNITTGHFCKRAWCSSNTLARYMGST